MQRRVQVFDVVFALVVTTLGVVEVWAPLESVQGDGHELTTAVLVVISGVALTQRRSHPVLVGLVVLFPWFVVDAVTTLMVVFFGQFVPNAIAVFTMARHGAGRVPFVGAAMGAAALLCVYLSIPVLATPGETLFHWVAFVLVWLFGFRLRHMDLRAHESTRRAIDAEVAAAEQAMAAVIAERTRIARELHDIVAHSVSMMVVQAGAAEQVVQEDPDFTRNALRTIRTSGTDALSEMRRVVAILRDSDEPGSLAPQPGLGSLQVLVDDARAAGLQATLDVTGARRELPAGVDLAAYRIVQEALTNVRRHARAHHVTVALAYGRDDVRIEVVDDGVGATDTHGGHGLMGMRERAALYGGNVEAGSINGSGFAVRVTLPAGSSA